MHHCFHRSDSIRSLQNVIPDLSSESEHEPSTKKIKREPSLASFENIHQLYPELQSNGTGAIPSQFTFSTATSESEEEEESAPSDGDTK